MHFFSENAYALLLLLLLCIDIVHLHAPLTECRPCVCGISGSGAVGSCWFLMETTDHVAAMSSEVCS